MLKTIEEPPKGVYIIILCENLELILDTIKSRCEIYKLTPLSKEELNKYIQIKEYEYSNEQIMSAIAFSEGVPGRIDRYFNDEKLKEVRDKIVDLLFSIINNDVEAVLDKESVLLDYKDNKEEALNLMSSIVRDVLINKEVYNDELIINGDKIEDIKKLTNEMSFKKINNFLVKIEEARRNIKSNVSWAMNVRVMLMGFMEG